MHASRTGVRCYTGNAAAHLGEQRRLRGDGLQDGGERAQDIVGTQPIVLALCLLLPKGWHAGWRLLFVYLVIALL